MLNINPKMLPRLDEIEEDLLTRRHRAEHEGWLGEVEGIDLTLAFLRQKREETQRLTRIAPIDLGIPGIPSKESCCALIEGLQLDTEVLANPRHLTSSTKIPGRVKLSEDGVELQSRVGRGYPNGSSLGDQNRSGPIPERVWS